MEEMEKTKKENSCGLLKAVIIYVLITVATLLLATGFAGNFGRPYINKVCKEWWLSNTKHTTIIKDPWPIIWGERLHYHRECSQFNPDETVSIFTNKGLGFKDKHIFMTRPLNGIVDYVSITKGGNDVLNISTRYASKEYLIENKDLINSANERFNEIKKELKVEELLKNLASK